MPSMAQRRYWGGRFLQWRQQLDHERDPHGPDNWRLYRWEWMCVEHAAGIQTVVPDGAYLDRSTMRYLSEGRTGESWHLDYAAARAYWNAFGRPADELRARPPIPTPEGRGKDPERLSRIVCPSTCPCRARTRRTRRLAEDEFISLREMLSPTYREE